MCKIYVFLCVYFLGEGLIYMHVWVYIYIYIHVSLVLRERQTDINMREKHRLVASCMCPDLGIELATFWSMGRHCNQLSHTAGATCKHLLCCLF